MVQILLLFLFFVLSFLMVYQIYIRRKTNQYQKKNYFSIPMKENLFQLFISKFNFIKTKDDFLLKQGYPLHLNSISYYILKLFLTIILFIISFRNYGSIIPAFLFAVIGFFLIDFYLYSYKKSRDSEICNDLLNVTNSICLQLSAHVSLKDSLKKQFENCNNKDLKKAFMILSAKYELSELNIEEALIEFRKCFDILEINLFCAALSDENRTGNITEILENLADLLQEKYMDKLSNITRTKILYITFGVIIALLNIVLLTFYPLIISIGKGFQTIFR